jgi:hypothetical protein
MSVSLSDLNDRLFYLLWCRLRCSKSMYSRPLDLKRLAYERQLSALRTANLRQTGGRPRAGAARIRTPSRREARFLGNVEFAEVHRSEYIQQAMMFLPKLSEREQRAVAEANRVKESKRLEQLAREGRAFGIGLIIGTQYPKDMTHELSGALATKIFLYNQDPDMQSQISRMLAAGQGKKQQKLLQQQVASLSRFQAFVRSSKHVPYKRVNVTPYFSRPDAVVGTRSEPA